MNVDARLIAGIVRDALAEDNVLADATIALLEFGEATVSADIIAGEDAVIAGIDCSLAAFALVDDAVVFEARATDGTHALAGDVVARVEGRADSILRSERVALNFLQHLTGVATLTSRFVARVAGSSITILDTRKTTPLWRDLEKHAVRCGGGSNHRRDLGAMVLVKENHVRALGGAHALVDRLRAVGHSGDRPFIEVEVDSLEFLEQLLGAPVDRVMLDNFTPDGVQTAVERINHYRRSHAGVALEVEVSGGITLDTIDAYNLPGIDFISVGALTHSAPAVSLSLEVR